MLAPVRSGTAPDPVEAPGADRGPFRIDIGPQGMSSMTSSIRFGGSSASPFLREMKTWIRSERRREGRRPLRDPALWAWLIVAMLAMIPAASVLHVMLA